MVWNGKIDHFEPKLWECKICNLQYTSLQKGYGGKCWQGHILTRIKKAIPLRESKYE